MMVVSSGIGVVELLILIFSGGFGLPLSIPPAAEDPQLARIAPDDCLYYTSWAGTTEPDPDSPNRTERWLAQQEVQQFLHEVETQLQKGLAASPARRAPFPVDQVLPWGKLLLTRPTAFFISDLVLHREPDDREPDDREPVEEANLELGDSSLTIRGAMVINLGAAKDDFARSLRAVRDTLNGAHEISIGKTSPEKLTFMQWSPDPEGIQWTWGFKDDYFIVASDEASAAAVIERFDTPTPQWLERLRQQHPVPRRATFTYANLKKITTLLTAQADPEWAETIGIDELRSFIAVTGLDERGYVSKTVIGFDPESDGLLSTLASEPLSPEHLAHLPTDSTVAVAARIDGALLLETILSVVELFNPRFPQAFAQFEQMAMQQVGFKFSDVLRGLGDTWTLHAAPEDGGILTGWTLTTSVRKPDELAQYNQSFIAFFDNLHGDRSPRVRAVTVGDKQFHTFVVPDDDFLVAPSWFVDEEKFVFSLFPQATAAMIAPESIETGLSKAPKCAHLFESDVAPSLVVYLDTATVSRIAYPLLQVGARRLLGRMQRQGLSIDLAMVPSLRTITRHLEPSLFSAHRTPQGLVLESHRTIPGGSLGAAAPALVALAMPAVGSAQAAAERAQATNQLKQLMLAMHNYHSAHNCFPPAYTTDAEGKPLLSWRVHILPFLEQSALYDQFKLDEPWDSPHNRKLIARMPALFKSPGSEVDPGKTSYLALGGKHGVFGDPRAGRAARPAGEGGFGEVGGAAGRLKRDGQGTQLREVTDGTSNTIGLVEASDELAVIWTKPDLFVPKEDDPTKGLSGLRNGLILMGFCDGSVRSVSDQIDPSTLWALFTKDGGEVINAGSF